MKARVSKKELAQIHKTLELIKIINIFGDEPILHRLTGALPHTDIHLKTVFGEMKKYKSVVIPAKTRNGKYLNVMNDVNVYMRINTAVNDLISMYPNRRFLTRAVEDGIRVWRVA